MTDTVDQDTKQFVEIKPGWLIMQFARYVFGLTEEYTTFERTGPHQLVLRNEKGWADYQLWLNPQFLDALIRFDDLVIQKDYQYDSSWQTLGTIIPMADMIDKLGRLKSASRNGAALAWDPDKKIGTQFDLIVRNLMIMCWERLNFTDDDDDRQITPDRRSTHGDGMY